MSNLFGEQVVEVVSYPKGKLLFRQGEPGTAAFIINSGSIGIFREVEKKKMPLATLREGELFGEMAVLDGSPRMASAVTLEPCTLMVISVETMNQKMGRTDPFVKALLSMLMSNLRNVHAAYTPKARSFLDAVNALNQQSEMVTKFVAAKGDELIDADTLMKVGQLNEIVKDLRTAALELRAIDRRHDAVPDQSDLDNATEGAAQQATGDTEAPGEPPEERRAPDPTVPS